jgi:hypothetical protein
VIRFPDRIEWEGKFQPYRKGGFWYTDESKKIKALVLGCMNMAQGASLALALDNNHSIPG